MADSAEALLHRCEKSKQPNQPFSLKSKMVSIVVNYDECGMLNGPYYGHYFDVNPFDASVPHPASLCEGNCSKHPLITKSLLPFTHEKMLVSWGDSVFYETLEEERTLTHFQKMERAAAALVEEAARKLNKEALVREQYAQTIKEKAQMGLKRNEKPKKIQQPCKWVVGQFKGDECWAYEYTDPKTGKRETPHTCQRLHIGEEGWHNEWLTNPRWEPPATGFEARFQGVKGKRGF